MNGCVLSIFSDNPNHFVEFHFENQIIFPPRHASTLLATNSRTTKLVQFCINEVGKYLVYALYVIWAVYDEK